METHDPQVTPPVGAPRIICNKCGTRNPHAAVACSQCGAHLLPGRTAGQRILRFFVGLLVAGALFALGALTGRRPELMWLTWLFAIQGFAALVASVSWAVTRTPEYERYVQRAERHRQAEPEQALADLNTALVLAPPRLDKVRQDLTQRIAALSASLGREPPPVTMPAPLGPTTEGSSQPVQGASKLHRGCLWGSFFVALFFGLLFIMALVIATSDMARGSKASTISGGLYTAILSLAFLVLFGLFAAVLAQRKGRAAIIWGGSVVALLVAGALILFLRSSPQQVRSALLQTPLPRPTATPRPSPTVVARAQVTIPPSPAPASPAGLADFQEEVFSFRYPAGWQVIGQDQVATLRKTSLKGMKTEQQGYIGGVYSEGVDNCKGCASVVLLIVKQQGFPGSLTDEQFKSAEQATRKQMGSRLVSYRKIEVSGMVAVESVHLGASGTSKLWEVTIFPPQPDVIYLVSCSSHKDSYATFEAAFAGILQSLRVGAPGGAAPPAATGPAPTGAPLIHVVKQGDTLSKIAAQYGVTMESIRQANGIDDPNKIQVGQRLVIPAAGNP